MEFTEEYLQGIKTPILTPKTVQLIGLEGSKVRYLDYLPGIEYVDEVHFYHGTDKLVLHQFAEFFPMDIAAIVLFDKNKKLLVHRRAKGKKWASDKITIAGVSGRRNAVLREDHFENESWEEAALREMKEETNLPDETFSHVKLAKLGENLNEYTHNYMAVFAAQLPTTVRELQENLSKYPSIEIQEWIEDGYQETLEKYFGDKVEDYVGGSAMRPYHFLSNAEIKKALDDYYQAL